MMEVRLVGKLPSCVSRGEIHRAIRLTFHATRRRSGGDLAIVFVSNTKMQNLNHRFRHRNSPTDVLSFSSAPERWGDIVLAPAYIRASARAEHIPFREELLRVLIHGILHLFGYEHDTPNGSCALFRIQERVVQTVAPRDQSSRT